MGKGEEPMKEESFWSLVGVQDLANFVSQKRNILPLGAGHLTSGYPSV